MRPGRFAVIGAGLAGLACARRLAAAGHAVRVFDKSRAPGGRMATRRVEQAAWDHGAQYFTVSTPAFRAVVDAARETGQVDTWSPRWPGGEQEQRELWVGVPGINALPRWLAEGLDLSLGTQIVGLERAHRAWTLRDDTGRTFEGFDFVVLGLPAPQAAALAAGHGTAAVRLAAVGMAPCWALLLAFERPVESPLDADWSPDPVLPWIARNSAKPRRSGLDAWVLHADAEWSREWLEAEAARVTAALRARLAERLSAELPPVALAEAHRWRHARVIRPLGEPCLVDEGAALGFCGDWCLDARVEAAFLSGDALGARLEGWNDD
ncbi:MAG: NAD/FAD-dependent oxidoreductase [Proteobacteria bacterium]|nr:NAD/FAD-dependent oxidoreductase [Pseudomonadota bacterium]